MRLHTAIIPVLLTVLLVGCRSRPGGVDYNQWKEALKPRRATAVRHVTALPGVAVARLRGAPVLSRALRRPRVDRVGRPPARATAATSGAART